MYYGLINVVSQKEMLNDEHKKISEHFRWMTKHGSNENDVQTFYILFLIKVASKNHK